MKVKLTRREFVIGSAGFTTGIAIGSQGLNIIKNLITSADKETSRPIKVANKPPLLPWPYKKLDPEKVAKIAYENWYKEFCAYAVTSAILLPLCKEIGEPYTSFPLESVRWGHGGVVGWGTTCGTLLGAGFALSLIAGKEGENILNDLIYWYTKSELPIYEPENPKARIRNRNKSNSPLCHISVGKWMKKEDVRFYTLERKERCARLSADVASKTVKLLNEWKDGKYTPVHKSQAKTHQITAQNNCLECHRSLPIIPGTKM